MTFSEFCRELAHEYRFRTTLATDDCLTEKTPEGICFVLRKIDMSYGCPKWVETANLKLSGLLNEFILRMKKEIHKLPDFYGDYVGRTSVIGEGYKFSRDETGFDARADWLEKLAAETERCIFPDTACQCPTCVKSLSQVDGYLIQED
jgi:hypothetical protein